MQRLQNALIAIFTAGALSFAVRSYFLREDAGRAHLCDKGYVAAGDGCVPEDLCLPPFFTREELPSREDAGSPRTMGPLGPSADATIVSATGKTCVLKVERIKVQGGDRRIGASDWEAVGSRPPEARLVHVAPFEIDNVELHVNGKPRVGMSFEEARSDCERRGGRLPSEDEWMLAAMGDREVRYPWGQTGSQCGRAVWGRANGPCRGAHSSDRALDLVATHPSGKTASGIYDLGGGVAEWVTGPHGEKRVKGGSWRTELVSELRVWWFLDRDPDSHEDWIGARCAYDLSGQAPAAP